MAKVYADRVLESTVSTGAGTIALAGAVAGFQRFNAVCTIGDTVDYSIYAVDGSGAPTGAWETGIGTYSAANVLTRTTVKASSNANAAVTFAAGTKLVMISANAATFARIGTGKPWYFDVPDASGFSFLSGDGDSAVLTYDNDAGLYFNGGPATFGRVYRAAVTSISSPSTPWTFTGRINPIFDEVATSSAAFGVRNSSTGYFIMFGFLNNGTLGLYRQSSLTAFVDGAEINQRYCSRDLFSRFLFDGTNYTAQFSPDGKNFTTFNSYTSSALGGVADQIGIFGLTVNGPIRGAVAVIDRFVLS